MEKEEEVAILDRILFRLENKKMFQSLETVALCERITNDVEQRAQANLLPPYAEAIVMFDEQPDQEPDLRQHEFWQGGRRKRI